MNDYFDYNRCPTTGKRSYSLDEVEMLIKSRKAMNDVGLTKKPWTYYRCPLCYDYHFSTRGYRYKERGRK